MQAREIKDQKEKKNFLDLLLSAFSFLIGLGREEKRVIRFVIDRAKVTRQ